jgi:NAD(P)H-dependent FMN reductase
MKLTIFNGSPRGKKSNTEILMNHFIRGFTSAGENRENQANIGYLVHIKKTDNHVKMFAEAQRVILAFPLYTDAMPGIVKYFIEQLEPLCGKKNNFDMGFLVQSGFPEAHHSRFIEKYLEKLAARLGGNYLGTVVKGGVEGIQIKPPYMTKKLFNAFYRLGYHFGKTGTFNREIIQSLAKSEHLSGFARFLYKLLALTGLTDFYWNSQLKKNNAYNQRFNKPYLRLF